MAGKQSRREPRIDLDLTVTLLLPDGEVEYPVADASYRGVFLISENPLPLRKLVRFRTQLDADEEPLQMMGLVAHHISTGEAAEIGRDPGMGIHLFSVGEETHRRWRQFIREHY
ncbi:MAG: PilZ domain-containing protein, partial [Bradymonadaceae bacterium]